MFQEIDRVYVNEKARRLLNWKPKFDFEFCLNQIDTENPFASEFTMRIGKKSLEKDYYYKNFDL